MTDAEFQALLVLATATSFTPGPNTTLSTTIAANRGLRHALPFVLAVPVGWGLLLLLCATGLGALVLAVPLLRGAILLGGVAYLVWLAGRLARSGTLAQADPARLQVGFVQGVLLQFLNIKAWMLGLTVAAGWIAGRPDAVGRTLQVLPLMLAYGLGSNLTYASVGALLRDWLARGQRLLWFNRLMALALVGTAAWLLRGTW